MRYMKKVIVFIMVCAFLFLVGCGNKNFLFKDDVYTITRGDQGVTVSVNKGAVVPNLHDAAKKYIDTDSLPCLAILNYKDNKLTVASHYYDGDSKDDFKLWKLTAADDIVFSMVSIVDDKGIVSIDNITIPRQEYQYIGEYYTGGYFDFDNSGKVTHVIIYGETVIQ